MTTRADTLWIEAHAKTLGFDLCGVVRAEKFPELAQTGEWLARGYAGEMRYLADPRRGDPHLAMPGVCSVIVCALNYNTSPPSTGEAARQSDAGVPRGWVSRYAWGADYHLVVREKLDALAMALRGRFAEPFEARIYADTGPVQERILAKYAGLGWLGKNTLLLNQRLGSWMFLGAILTTLDLAPSLGEAELPPPDLCGSCRRCIDACPTAAFVEPYVMDARRCISYLTIELRGAIPENFREPLGRHVFGCDICQDVCPWNRRSPLTSEQGFQPRTFAHQPHPATADAASEPLQNLASSPEAPAALPAPDESLFLPSLEWLASMKEEDFRAVFRDSAIKRAKWRGLLRNACIALGNSQPRRGTPAYHRVAGLLNTLAVSGDPTVAESALWALSRIE
jgi:epoxyqueuosine reductase